MELKMLPQYPSTLWALSSWRTNLAQGGGIGYQNYMRSLSRMALDTVADTIRDKAPGMQVGILTDASPVAPKAFTATKSNFFSSIMALTSVLPLPSTVQLAEVLEPASFWALFCHTASVRMPTQRPVHPHRTEAHQAGADHLHHQRGQRGVPGGQRPHRRWRYRKSPGSCR